MTTSPEALREAVERLTVTAQNDKLVMSPDIRLVLSALQEAREALDDIDRGYLVNHSSKWVRARVRRALSPGEGG